MIDWMEQNLGGLQERSPSILFGWRFLGFGVTALFGDGELVNISFSDGTIGGWFKKIVSIPYSWKVNGDEWSHFSRVASSPRRFSSATRR